MISSFPIYRVEPKDRYGTNTGIDAEGRFYKYWCNHPELGHCLFKAASPDGFTPIKTDDIHAIFEQLPTERIDKVTNRFAIDLLDFNLQNLLSGSERLVIEQTSIDVQEELGR